MRGTSLRLLHSNAPPSYLLRCQSAPVYWILYKADSFELELLHCFNFQTQYPSYQIQTEPLACPVYGNIYQSTCKCSVSSNGGLYSNHYIKRTKLKPPSHTKSSRETHRNNTTGSCLQPLLPQQLSLKESKLPSRERVQEQNEKDPSPP